MSWWDSQISLTWGEFIMSVLAGVGMASILVVLAHLVADVIEVERHRRTAKKRRE